MAKPGSKLLTAPQPRTPTSPALLLQQEDGKSLCISVCSLSESVLSNPRGGSSFSYSICPAPGTRLCTFSPSLMRCVLFPPSRGISAAFHTFRELPLGLLSAVATFHPREGAGPDATLAISTGSLWLLFPPPRPLVPSPSTA